MIFATVVHPCGATFIRWPPAVTSVLVNRDFSFSLLNLARGSAAGEAVVMVGGEGGGGSGRSH